MTIETNFKPRRLTAAEKCAARRRGGWRTAKRRSRHGGSTWAGEKAAAKRHELRVKAATRAEVWRRSSVCECCGRTEWQTAMVSTKATHEAHEVRPRSLTRGRPPEERFSPANTARVCPEPCHRQLQRHERELKPHDAVHGMTGSYDVVSADGEVLRTVNRNV